MSRHVSPRQAVEDRLSDVSTSITTNSRLLHSLTTRRATSLSIDEHTAIAKVVDAAWTLLQMATKEGSVSLLK